LRWHRRLIARKWAAERRVGRPGVMREIQHLAVQMARENPVMSRGWIDGREGA